MPRLIDHDQRRQELAEATWRVIMRDGVGGASVRSVAAEAGRSPGSLRHLFASQSELLAFALRLVVDRATARVADLPPQDTAIATVIAVAAQMLPLDPERRAEMEVYLALFTAANADPALRVPRDEAYRELRQACGWMIAQLDNGVDLDPRADQELEALRLHALIDGLATHLVCEPADADPEWARRVLTHHLRSLHTESRTQR
ncbi:TetR/AcrR family transcriptional regulator [Microlunatus speluncae]|uniref:TetR/AcrR family transcriptional regulator n=1 Tax=Microlunatus speluncae TaxID=2594267 RepID=UPI0012662116|nr:TetR family transcriptional regulator C-terminal domain-containing protein [Microlunatus speluncae]